MGKFPPMLVEKRRGAAYDAGSGESASSVQDAGWCRDVCFLPRDDVGVH
jgi:hypothetical protein